MSEVSDKIAEEIRKHSIKENFERLPQESSAMRKRKRWSTIKRIAKLLGIGRTSRTTINTSTQTNSNYNTASSTFKEDYKVSTVPTAYTFDPVAADNLRIYLQGQDGRGDPPGPPPDSHHHDER